MAKISDALRQVLDGYDIPQTKLAKAMGIRLTTLNNWVVGISIPSAERIPKIYQALQSIEPEAAEEFIRL
jgi:transcriptional regulator with XRE-family HTH domain